MHTINSKNDIAAIGYSTGECFMTVHANKAGIYTVNDVPGVMIRESATGFNKIKRVKNIADDPLMSLSVYRSDMSAGNTHVSIGMIKNVFIPVSVRGESIHRENFAFIFCDKVIKQNKFYIRMERMANIHNIDDIRNLNQEVFDMGSTDTGEAPENFTRTEIKIGNKTMIIFAPGSARADITWQTATGKRIIACAERFAGCNLTKHLGVPINTPRVLPEHHFRKVFNNGKWYDFVYVADKVVCTNEFIPDFIYEIDGEECFVMSKVVIEKGRDNRMVIVKYCPNGTCVDYCIDKDIFMKPCFDPVEYVKDHPRTGYIGLDIEK